MKNSLGKLSFWRSKARILFKVLLAAGFIVQSYSFLQMYLQYPSMLQLSVEQPDEVEFPAFTLCNLNEIRATPFCENYPQKCGSPETDPNFCEKFSGYCNLVNDSKRLVPKVDIEDYHHLSRYEQQLFGHQWNDMVVRCEVHIDDNVSLCEGTPILVPALSHSYNVPYNCFMMYSLYKQPYAQPQKVARSAVIHLQLNVEVAEYHPYHLSRGAQISIHSPYHVPSPTSDGQLLNLGTIYRFYMKLVQQNLLPAPYKSNCSDYMTQWTKNGGKGPVTNNYEISDDYSREICMCLEKCKLDMSLREYGCADPKIDYPHNETLCIQDLPDFQKRARFECSSHCSMSCTFTRYEFQVQEANSEGNRKACMHSNDLSCAILVQIFLENMEITTFTYKPTFEAVGILSWIGGYVGLWLGISLLHVYDFLEQRIFRLVAVIQKKIRKKKTMKKNLWKIADSYSNHKTFRPRYTARH